MYKLVFDLTSQNANIGNGNIQQTVYDKKSLLKLKKIPEDTQMKKVTFTQDFPIKLIENRLVIERELLEIGMFYSLRHNDEELLIRKTVDGKIQIYEVLE